MNANQSPVYDEAREKERTQIALSVPLSNILERYGVKTNMLSDGCTITSRCPIHKGRNKNAFQVNVTTNTWRCNSNCGLTGNTITFVALMECIPESSAAELIIKWRDLV